MDVGIGLPRLIEVRKLAQTPSYIKEKHILMSHVFTEAYPLTIISLIQNTKLEHKKEFRGSESCYRFFVILKENETAGNIIHKCDRLADCTWN